VAGDTGEVALVNFGLAKNWLCYKGRPCYLREYQGARIWFLGDKQTGLPKLTRFWSGI